MKDSPKNPWFNAITFTIFILFLVFKEYYEDIPSQNYDKVKNKILQDVYSFGNIGFSKKPTRDLKAGDFIACWSDQEIPADILIVFSSGNTAFVDRTKMDGEMVIKEKYPTLRDYDHNSIQPLLGHLKC